ncbi:MAG: DUF6498-containing protein [Gammaproteobacteria bacterium]
MPGLPYRIDLPQLALLLANLLPLIGVLWLGWDVGSIVVLYWTENLIVGAYTVLRMLTTGGVHALFLIAFFCLHYGGFCAIHGLFVLELTGFAGLDQAASVSYHWPGPLVVLEKFVTLVQQILAAAPEQFIWACLALLISHGASFLLLFIGQQEYRHTTVNKLMTAPYKRIALLHIAVIAGGFLVMQLGSPLGLLLALVALKTGMDIMLHIRSHQSLKPAGQASAPGEEHAGE